MSSARTSRQHPGDTSEQLLDPVAAHQTTNVEDGMGGTGLAPALVAIVAVSLTAPAMSTIIVAAMVLEDRYGIALVGSWNADEPGAPFDAGEQEGDGARRQLGQEQCPD